MNHKRILILSAPSGTGKGTVIKRILELTDYVCTSVSATTREPRPGEVDGKDYYFISKEQFLSMIDNHEFLEYAEYSGNYYGTPLKPLEINTDSGLFVILEIDVKGFSQVKALMPDALSIFLVPPSMEELERRLRGRGTETEDSIQKRLKAADTELKMAGQFDYTVVNDIVDRAAQEIITIINNNK